METRTGTFNEAPPPPSPVRDIKQRESNLHVISYKGRCCNYRGSDSIERLIEFNLPFSVINSFMKSYTACITKLKINDP